MQQGQLPEGNPTSYRVLFEDAEAFLAVAKEVSDEVQVHRYLRATLFCLWGAMEAYLHCCSRNNRFTPDESAYLRDRHLILSIEKADLIEEIRPKPLPDKVKFLIGKSIIDYDFTCAEWRDTERVTALRDVLVGTDGTMVNTEIIRERTRKGLLAFRHLVERTHEGLYGSGSGLSTGP